jgi:uncharacterized protein DUF1842
MGRCLFLQTIVGLTIEHTKKEFPMAEQPDLYYVRVRLQSVLLGSPVLTLDMTVRGGSGDVKGEGVIGQSVTPTQPGGKVIDVAGEIFRTGRPKDELLVHLTGKYIFNARPPAIGTFGEPFSAALDVDREWNGKGSFAFGRYHSGECMVTNITPKVTEETPLADADAIA